MSEPASASAEGAAAAAAKNAAPNASEAAKDAAKALPKQNEAFRMMGLPRLRLPSRNWLIFLGVTGSFFSAVYYDKYQTRRARDKWCKLVSHLPDEPLPTKSLPRRVTIYLEAPPGDGLRAAREHFHAYIKPVLVAAAMDWDVVEGRKEGDVRWKTAENVRKRRRRGGKGEKVPEEEYSVEIVREKAGTEEFAGVAGDLVVGRHTWKEYVRGLHEGWLGPVDAPVKEGEAEDVQAAERKEAAAVDLAKEIAANASSGDQQQSPVSSLSDTLASTEPSSQSTSSELHPDPSEDEAAQKKKEEEKEPPKPRHPPAYIQPSDYPSATLSALTPELIGPATPIPFPHLLGFRNTPTRIYRFLNRRKIADDVGRQVAAAILASHRPYTGVSGSGSVSEGVEGVLKHEERDWWKTTYRAREAHEESVWIEPCEVDERLASRMRLFELTGEEADRAARIGAGKEGLSSR